MDDNTLILDDDEPIEQVTLENFADMDIAGDGDDEQDIMDEYEAPEEEPEDDDFKLDGYNDLGIISEESEDDEDAYDPEYDDDNVAGQKRKRVKPTFAAQPTRSLQRAANRIQTGNTDAFILDEDTGFVTKPSSRVPGTFGRRGHRKGETLPAYHKRVSHELDSDDELMMEMREKGFSDRQIADKLAKEGRVRYDQKSISTRIGRIRLAQASNVDFLLKEGYKEWEFEDDCLLMQAYALANIEVNYEVERMHAWRFRKVADYMRRLNKDNLFSETACRERYMAMTDGTARIPTDMDDDPDARRMQLEVYRSTREENRNKEQAIKDAKETRERKVKEAAKIKNAQKAEEIAYKRQQKEEEKAQRAMQRATAAQVRSQRATENTAAKVARNAQIKRQEDDHVKRTTPKGKGKGKEKEKVTAKKATNPSKTLFLTNAQISERTPDPRGYLSVADLTKMCADRGISTFGKGKDQLVADLQDADFEWSAEDLKTMCRSKGLNTSGNKVAMRYHLALAAAQVCTSFEGGVAAAMDEEMDDE
ncbi:hypothetical protein CC86DRAFT_191948 [Ophiobolus disseminans]|uniref:DUF7626 domain-containing protein n=1 Tax=Ophiobolus disseminans TaxID=1469910 RepID=A0A6A7A4W1_9PLEO|nr:hypothetical protein CC86DRAFT_191948 [Ophiobolus disseminans]